MIASKGVFILSLVAIVIWVALVPGRLIGTRCWQEFQLARYAARTPAIITALEPNNHRSVHYSYHVGSASFDAVDQGGIEGRFDDLKIGQEVTAHFLPANPHIVRLGSPRNALMNDIIPFALFLIFLTAILTYQFRKYIKAGAPG